MAHETTPTIHLIARPAVDLDGMRAYLNDVGGARGSTGAPKRSSPEPRRAAGRIRRPRLLSELGAGLNANVTKVRADQRDYLRNILKSAHGSVLEHANYSFALRNVSRVATHEIVRHRAGAAYSQESLRYVRLVDVGFRVPPPSSLFAASASSWWSASRVPGVGGEGAED